MCIADIYPLFVFVLRAHRMLRMQQLDFIAEVKGENYFDSLDFGLRAIENLEEKENNGKNCE